MHLNYIHYFGNEASQSLLKEYGIITKDQKDLNILKPKQCPNCNEPNKPDSKFCAKCRFVLTYDAYNETLDKQQEKDSEIQRLKEKQEQDIRLMREEMQQNFADIISLVQQNSIMKNIKPEALSHKMIEKNQLK
jgi:hypothetical protein